MSKFVTDMVPASQQSELLAHVPVFREEIRRRPVLLASIFAGIALTALAVGALIPKKFASSTSILVKESSIITPLMEGRAVATGVSDRAALTKEVAFSRRVMHEILRVGGWLSSNPSPVEQDKLIERIISRTQISNPQPNLIRITYSDPLPQRAFEVTKHLADLVIKESLDAKERESREAYQFINQQVEQYHKKLTNAEVRLEQYRNTNPDARPGVSAEVGSRINELSRQVENNKLNLIDLQSQASALRAQLSGESQVNAVETIAGALSSQLIDLRAERAQLLLNYTEQHPDVVRIQHQINDLQEQIRAQRARPTRLIGASAELNPLYAELKSKLADTERQASATAARIASAEAMLAAVRDRGLNISAAEGDLAELTRDYEVNRDLYQDLLKRRENARVSMSLDAERRGLSFRIQEPAVVPLRPQGLRMLYVAIAGLVLAVLAPLGLLFALVKFDPRVRSSRQIEEMAGLPVLGSVPRYNTAAAHEIAHRRFTLAAGIAAAVPIIYGLTLILKWLQS